MANAKKRTVKKAPVKKAPVKANKAPKVDEALDALIAKACRGDAVSRVGVRDRKPAEVMPRLLALFEHESPKLRAGAIMLASTPLAFVKLLPLAKLLGKLDDPDPTVRAAAAVGFSYSFPYEPFFKPQLATIKPKLEALLKDADTKVRARAQHALEELQREPD